MQVMWIESLHIPAGRLQSPHPWGLGSQSSACRHQLDMHKASFSLSFLGYLSLPIVLLSWSGRNGSFFPWEQCKITIPFQKNSLSCSQGFTYVWKFPVTEEKREIFKFCRFIQIFFQLGEGETGSLHYTLPVSVGSKPVQTYHKINPVFLKRHTPTQEFPDMGYNPLLLPVPIQKFFQLHHTPIESLVHTAQGIPFLATPVTQLKCFQSEPPYHLQSLFCKGKKPSHNRYHGV